MKTKLMAAKTKAKSGLMKCVIAASPILSMMGMPVIARADGGDDFGSVTVSTSSGSATSLMGKIIGILLTITRYVGVALVIYGVYEIVMSFMQNQPEAKTKGIVMALAGVVMIGLKSIIVGLGIIG